MNATILALRDHNVLRLQVPMCDAFTVTVLKAVRKLHSQMAPSILLGVLFLLKGVRLYVLHFLRFSAKQIAKLGELDAS